MSKVIPKVVEAFCLRSSTNHGALVLRRLAVLVLRGPGTALLLAPGTLVLRWPAAVVLLVPGGPSVVVMYKLAAFSGVV